jgi:hypothetical protein
MMPRVFLLFSSLICAGCGDLIPTAPAQVKPEVAPACPAQTVAVYQRDSHLRYVWSCVQN